MSMTIWIIIISVGTTINWLMLVFVVPRNLLSVFRYQLWALRDDLLTDIYEKRLPAVPGVWRLFHAIEGTIAQAPSITFWRFLFVPKPSAEKRAELSAVMDAAFAQMHEEQKKLFVDRIDTFRMICVLHLVTGSPSGWPFYWFVKCAVRMGQLKKFFRNGKDWFGKTLLSLDEPQTRKDLFACT